MTSAAPFTRLSDTFAIILGDVLRIAGRRLGSERSTEPTFWLLWHWLRRMIRRFATLSARAGAGVRPQPRPRSRRKPAPDPAAEPPPPRPGLPQDFGWLVALLHWEVAGYGSQLAHLLRDPEMAALLEAEPRLAPMLRPLCRMLAIDPADIPGLAPSPRRPKPPPAPVAAIPPRQAPPEPPESPTKNPASLAEPDHVEKSD